MRETRASVQHGFTVIEVMIVVSIIGLMAVLIIPALQAARRRSQDTAFVNDIRIFVENVFHMYSIEHGDYPPDEAAGVLPPDVAGYAPRRYDFTAPTPIGGLWDWDRAEQRGEQIHGCYAGLSVALPGRTSAQMEEIDIKLDDGDLNTGTFRSRPGGYIYILDP